MIKQWLQDEFLPYLDGWEASVHERAEFSKKEMLLSHKTRTGLKLTGKVE